MILPTFSSSAATIADASTSTSTSTSVDVNVDVDDAATAWSVVSDPFELPLSLCRLASGRNEEKPGANSILYVETEEIKLLFDSSSVKEVTSASIRQSLGMPFTPTTSTGSALPLPLPLPLPAPVLISVPL